MPRGLVAAVDETDATVLLELAHRRLELQRALLGPNASASAALLLQAQHCRGLGVPVAAHLGPLLPGLHDEADTLDSLVQHVAAAAICDVHPSVGQLGIGRLRALAQTLDRSTLTSVLRAFDADAAVLDGRPSAGTTTWRPRRRVQMAMFHHARRVAEARGLRVDACGCAAQCHLARGRRREYLPVLGPGLFGQYAG
jgi:DNA repair photolyase